MNLRKWSLLFCVWSLFCASAFWLALHAPALIRETFIFPASAQGNPGWDTDGVYRKTASLLKKSDYAGLEKLAIDIKRRGYDIRQVYPELSAFYSSLKLKGSDDKHRWLDRQTEIDGWLRAYPDSLTAKIAMADWYIGYAWKARGTGWANTVSQEGWYLMHEYLLKAAEILESVENADDPLYYHLWITLAVNAESSKKREAERAFKRGVRLAPEFYPLYSNRAYYLLPRWFGESREREQFTQDCADAFPGEKGDILYAELMCDDASYSDETFFHKCPADYDRIRRGLLAEAATGRNRADHLSKLCHMASLRGDRETAQKLFLELGSEVVPSVFGDQEELERYRKNSGMQDLVDRAMALELRGDLAGAEKLWLSFQPDAKSNAWLKAFYMRQGMEAPLRESTCKTDGKTCAELLDGDVTQANPDALANLSRLGPQVGQWEKGEAAAQAFNQKRPWNVTGKITLWLCALHRGDKARAEALRQEFVALKTDRPAYKAAQAVLKGEKTWEQAFHAVKKQDVYLPQATTAIALYYLSQGQSEEARKVLQQALPLCRDTDEKRLLESLLFGALSRSLEPARVSSTQGS